MASTGRTYMSEDQAVASSLVEITMPLPDEITAKLWLERVATLKEMPAHRNEVLHQGLKKSIEYGYNWIIEVFGFCQEKGYQFLTTEQLWDLFQYAVIERNEAVTKELLTLFVVGPDYWPKYYGFLKERVDALDSQSVAYLIKEKFPAEQKGEDKFLLVALLEKTQIYHGNALKPKVEKIIGSIFASERSISAAHWDEAVKTAKKYVREDHYILQALYKSPHAKTARERQRQQAERQRLKKEADKFEDRNELYRMLVNYVPPPRPFQGSSMFAFLCHSLWASTYCLRHHIPEVKSLISNIQGNTLDEIINKWDKRSYDGVSCKPNGGFDKIKQKIAALREKYPEFKNADQLSKIQVSKI